MDDFSWVPSMSPPFYVNGSNVTILRSPHEFYAALKKKSRHSKKRIIFSSLYLGTGELDKKLVDCVEEALASAQPKSSLPNGSTPNHVTDSSTTTAGPQVRFLFDHSRGTRGSHNSCTMLQSLLQKYPDEVQVSLFHSPLLRGYLKRFLPDRWREIISVQHMKLYIFDDTLVISGANLSDHYYVNRQDRYIVIEDGRLADFCTELVDTVSKHSFIVSPTDGSLSLHPHCQTHPFQGT